MIKDLKIFFKSSIVKFVVISACAGYGIAFTVEDNFNIVHFISFILGTFFISAGSLSLNQVQEIENDKRMERTQERPLVKGTLSRRSGFMISFSFITIGLSILYGVNPVTCLIGASIILMYNGFYTLFYIRLAI